MILFVVLTIDVVDRILFSLCVLVRLVIFDSADRTCGSNLPVLHSSLCKLFHC